MDELATPQDRVSRTAFARNFQEQIEVVSHQGFTLMMQTRLEACIQNSRVQGLQGWKSRDARASTYISIMTCSPPPASRRPAVGQTERRLQHVFVRVDMEYSVECSCPEARTSRYGLHVRGKGMTLGVPDAKDETTPPPERNASTSARAHTVLGSRESLRRCSTIRSRVRCTPILCHEATNASVATIHDTGREATTGRWQRASHGPPRR